MVKEYYHDVTRLPSAAGYTRGKGGKGSHEKWVSGDGASSVVVPYRLMSRFTANAILKAAGIDHHF
jgi:predicted RNA binding protein YcfA (HicA-like mRNA interferase family)